MSNDPKDAVVDISKLMVGQSSTPKQNIPAGTQSSMITLCNEGAHIDMASSNDKSLIGFECFVSVKRIDGLRDFSEYGIIPPYSNG